MAATYFLLGQPFYHPGTWADSNSHLKQIITMKKTNAFPTQRGIYQLLQHEWDISMKGKQLKTPLQALGISPVDINWLLYSIEQQYEVEIEAEDVSLQVSLKDFVQLILKAGKN
jgi:hypothetical protein